MYGKASSSEDGLVWSVSSFQRHHCIFYHSLLSQVCFVTIHCETCIADILCKRVIDSREIKGSVLISMPVRHLLLLFIKEKLLIQVQSKAGASFSCFFPTCLTFLFFSCFTSVCIVFPCRLNACWLKHLSPVWLQLKSHTEHKQKQTNTKGSDTVWCALKLLSVC